MHFATIKAQESLRDISGSDAGTFCHPSEQLLGRLRSSMDYGDTGQIMQHGLHEFIDDFQSQLNEIGQAIHNDFFTAPTFKSPQNVSSQAQTSSPTSA